MAVISLFEIEIKSSKKVEKKNSDAGIRTRVDPVKAGNPKPLDYIGVGY